MPTMSALRSFEAAAQLLSFKEAAAQLHRTPSAISHQVRGLEAELGTALFHRDRHGLRLTEAGRAYLEAVSDALDGLVDATARLRRARGASGVTLSLFPSLAVRWLIPRLNDFRARWPGVEIELVSSVRRADFEGGAIDAAIRFGPGDWPGLRCDPLMVEERFPVCSAAVAAGPPRLRTPADLAGAILLHNGAHPGEWIDWLADAGAEGVPADRGPVFDASNEVLAAAVNGMGVALGRSPLVEPDLEAGRLVEPFAQRMRSPGRYWLVAPEATAERDALVALRAWLQEQCPPDASQ
ncbi:MAG: transcriptional regulator GcvA [Halofilum sp. (in: g-proteobacteria)]|nr:transcriptional regulator GcvA [Halofilum sp. (in: g-proteobacteria)]